MISVIGSRNGRKGVELGFGREEIMEETELEEGETCFNNEDDDDSSIDPDITLSYIDEKLQDVLGHFQKDFEGGVSAENLGAKFGGYGSFLPTYQRSPSRSHQRASPEVHSHTSRSPNNIHLEGGLQNSFFPSSAPLPVRPGIGSSNAMVTLWPPSGNGQLNEDVSVLSNHGQELASKFELQKSSNFPDPKTLKFRIKVGTDNVSTRKNAEIYSGLGLDVSPSSSLDESPADSGGLYQDPYGYPDQSPTSILQIITSVPFGKSLMISPLSDDMINLSTKEIDLGRSTSKTEKKGSQGKYRMVVNGSDLNMSNGKVLSNKKTKSIEKRAVSNNNIKDNSNGTLASRKEIDIDGLACKELVSSTLKLPLLSNSYSDCAELVKDPVKIVTNSKAAAKSCGTNASFLDVAKEEPLEHVAFQEKFNRKIDASGTILESRKQNCVNEDSVYHKKDVGRKEEKAEFSNNSESYVSEEKKNIVDTLKQKAVHKATSYNEDSSKLVPGERQLSSGGKKKFKGSQALVAAGVEFPGDGPVVNSSSVPKRKNISNSNDLMSKNDSEGLNKGDLKATDRYREFFGELELEQEDDEMASEETPFPRRIKDSEFVEKRSTSESNSTLKEKQMGKTTEERSVSGNHRRLSSNMAHLDGKALNADGAPTMAAPLVKEDWVCCDKCQTWRLLPLGMNPESLPEKWLCSMLNWLPGMNHCSISEEVTTTALRALYQPQASAAQTQHSQHAHLGGTLLGVPSGDARRSTEGSQNSVLKPTASCGKKKFGSKDVTITNATDQDSSVEVSDLKNNFQESSKRRNLNEVDLYPSVDEFAYQYEGDTMRSKRKNKKENGIEATKASKKVKTEDMLLKDEKCTSGHAGASSKAVRSSNSSFSNSASGKDFPSHSSRSRDSKGNPKKKSVLSEKPEVQMSITSDDGSLHMAKCGNDSLKKRKGSDHQKPSGSDLPLPSEGHNYQGSSCLLNESREYDHRKEKKARVSKSEGKDSNRSKDTVVTGKKAARAAEDLQMGKDLESTPSRMSIDAPDSLRRDLCSAQPAAAATSSSSKVSGSHRSKASHREMKGSPVESVSSSPLRISNADTFNQARNNPVVSKDDLQDASIFATASPRRFINGGDTGGSDQTGKMKDDSHNVINSGSLESSVIDFQARDLGHESNAKGKEECISFPQFPVQAVPCSSANPLDQDNQTACQTETSEQSRDERERNRNQYTSNGSQSKKSGKELFSRSKEKSRYSRAGFDNGKIKDADSFYGSMYEEKMKAGKNKSVEKSGCDRTEKSHVSKKDYVGKVNREIGKEESHHNGAGARSDISSSQNMMQNVQQQFDNERISRKVLSGKAGVEDSGRVKSQSLQLSVRGESEATTRFHAIGESKKDNVEHAFKQDDALKVSKQSKKTEKHNGNLPVNTRKLTPSMQKGRDLDAPSPARKDSSSQAVANAVKEAKDLKHMADRLKNSGSTDSTGLYFQAALKFLHGASLLESSGTENAKHNEMIQSMQMYSSTAKLCEFCAHEYEKAKDMAAAALAYKLVEVAYMRVIYTSHANASRDRHELQAALQIVPTDESPSSSASDIDNLNNPMTSDKAVIPKGVASPQVTGNHVLTVRNRSSCVQLINFAQDVNFAMEASRKSRTRFGEAQSRDGISSVKRALNFNFQDVDALLRLVRLAMEAITR